MDERPSELVATELRASYKGLKSGKVVGTVYYPRPSFVEKLKAIDPLLSVHWNRIRERWQVWRQSNTLGRPVVVMTVGSETYQTLDDRVIHALRRADAWTRGRDVLDEAEKEMRDRQDEVERDQSRQDEDWLTQEAYPRLKKDLSTEVSHSKADISVGAVNIPKEDVARIGRRRGRFGAGPAPRHLVPKKIELIDDLVVESE